MAELTPEESAEQARRRAALLSNPALIEQWSVTGELPALPEPDEQSNEEEM